MRTTVPTWSGVLGLVVTLGCGSSGSGDSDTNTDDAPQVDASPVTSCDPPGRFGVPEFTFTLPSGSIALAFADVQAAFPQVDWQTLDRLYIPAGTYTNIQLGNLPTRSAARPLIITNIDGQVVIGNNPQGNYLWVMNGGANWIVTGRYDVDSQTGNVDFPGHACGNYADSDGTYGFLSDDAYAFDAPYLHMGLAVGGATDVEIEYVEIARAGFAGIRLLNHRDDGLDKPMANMRVHDTYVHDVAGEGFYFGWTGGAPSNLMPGLQVFNNRILRSGNEALQIQDVGDGARIYNNTLLSGGTRWLDNGLGRYQDNLSQISVRDGTIEIHHNVFVDGAGSLVSFFSQPQDGDGARTVRFHDNYFANALSLGMYLGGTSTAGSAFEIDHNTFRDHLFGYTPVDPGATDPGVIIRRADDMQAPISVHDNHWDGAKALLDGIAGTDGRSGPVTATGNMIEEPALLALTGAAPFWSEPGRHLSSWAPVATVDPAMPEVTFRPDDVVVYGSRPDLYRCLADATGTPPPDAPGQWSAVARGADDVRVADGSAYVGLGVQ